MKTFGVKSTKKMETKIKSFKELGRPGQVLLIDNPLVKDDVCVLSSVMKTYKYAISDQSGRKYRMIDDPLTGRTKPDYADQNGETGSEKIDEYCILSSKAGSYTFEEDADPTAWNIRIITKDHPKYDKNVAKSGKQFGSMMNMMKNIFGED